MKLLSTLQFTDEELKSVEELGYEVIFRNENDIEFSEDIKDIDILFAYNPFKGLDISRLPNLKWIQIRSAGINQLPMDKVIDQNILITNNRGGYSIPIAEWIVLKTLEMFKDSKYFYEKQQNKTWDVNNNILELYGKTIGFVGTGSIAGEAAKRFAGFGVNLIGINTSGRDVQYFHECFSIKDIKDVINRCHVIVITVPYTEETHHFIDENVFRHMMDGAYIINIARGSIIDEEALIKNLKSGKIGKAALDVFETEPLPSDSPLWEMDNVYLSPHNSWISDMRRARQFDIIYKNLKRYKNNEELINLIDVKKGY